VRKLEVDAPPACIIELTVTTRAGAFLTAIEEQAP
jgi:hypothetical protein